MTTRNLSLATWTMVLVVGVSGCLAPEKQAPTSREASTAQPATPTERDDARMTAPAEPASEVVAVDEHASGASELRALPAPLPMVRQLGPIADKSSSPAAPPRVEAQLDFAAAEGRAQPEAKRKGAGVASGGMVMRSRAVSPAKPAATSTIGAMAIAPAPAEREFNTEAYAAVEEGRFLRTRDNPLSTFSIDVDTASYSNVRRFLDQGSLPPAGAVRIEELINYFPFDYPAPTGDAPVSVSVELSQAPWNEAHRLLRVGVQAKRVDTAKLPAQNLVFLLDVSGSMAQPNKLPLLKRSLATLVDTLREQDHVAIAVYAGASGLVLSPTSGADKAKILSALDLLEAGGSTNGGEGIELAYSVAERMAKPGAINRVILATDGDFNVGVSSQSELVRLIEHERKSGVFLSVLGFGMGNYKDSTLELLADKGNGNYAYIDSLAEAKKVMVAQAGATLLTLAKDVKIQIELNPAKVGAYRLIGYDNRRLAAEDFNDDAKDAGEMGAGHSVTALYEIVPPGVELAGSKVDPLRYQALAPTAGNHGEELATFKLRYKAPGSESSQLLEQTILDQARPLAETSESFRFAAAVATFGMALRGSSDRGRASFGLARDLARGALGADTQGYRRELVGLVERAEALQRGVVAPQSTISRTP
jgi:Ca-activated chloride channel family protein